MRKPDNYLYNDRAPRSIKNAKDFIDSKNYAFQSNLAKEIHNEGKEINPYKIEVNSVHAVKGQTHCATMYVETAYNTPVYETEKLKVISKRATKIKPEELLPYPICFQKQSYRQGKDVRAKESIKMMYVGFSRPTHLLCFAALKDNVGDTKPYEKAGWEVITDLIASVKNGGNGE